MNASAIKAFVVKDFKETFRDKDAVFWMIAWPLIWLVLTAYIFIPPGADQPRTMSIGLVDRDVSSGSPLNGSVLIRALEEAEYKGVKLFNVKIYENEVLLLEDIRRGRIDAGIIILATWAVDAIRNVIVFEAGLMEVSHYAIGTTLAALATLAIRVAVYKRMLRKYLER